MYVYWLLVTTSPQAVDTLQLPSNGFPDDPQLSHVNDGPTNATIGLSDAEDPLLYCSRDHQDHPEGASLASSSSPFRPAFDRRDPLPTEGSSPPQWLSYFEARPVRHTMLHVDQPLTLPT